MAARHKPGDLVQLNYEGHTVRGTVIATAKTEGGMGIRLLSIPGYDGLLARVPTRRLAPADPFTPVPADSIDRTAATPAQAQRILIILTLSLRNSELLRQAPDKAVLRDRARLADALGTWAGSGRERVLACAQAAARQIIENGVSLTPAQLAAESFPAPFDPAAPEPAERPNRADRNGTGPRPRRR